MTIHGFQFMAEIYLSEKRGNPLAIHGGRIISLLMLCNGDLVARFENGEWKLKPDCSFDEAEIALTMFVEKWRKYTPRKEDNAIIIKGDLNYE
jgi:hypothetical protein